MTDEPLDLDAIETRAEAARQGQKDWAAGMTNDRPPPGVDLDAYWEAFFAAGEAEIYGKPADGQP